MNIINKLIKYIELGIYSEHGTHTRFNLFRDDAGYPIIVDNNTRVRVEINPHEIIVKQYDSAEASGRLINKVSIDWECFTIPQKNKIIELIDVAEDLDSETEETLTTILTGVL